MHLDIKQQTGLYATSCQFQDLGREVTKDRPCVDGGLGAVANVVPNALFQVSVDTINGEREARGECISPISAAVAECAR